MSREIDFRRLTPDALDTALAEIGITSTEFAELTGTKRATVSRWFRDAGDPERLEPPFWVTQVLALAHLPGALERLRAVAALHRTERPARVPA